MRDTRFVAGIGLLLVTVLAWSGTFPIGKSAVSAIDPFWLAAIRYGIAVFAFVAVLAAVEGRSAFDYEGRFWAAAAIGAIGFGGFNTLAFIGLQHTRAEHVAIVNALQAPMIALVLWAWRGVRPAAFTLACVALAFVGVFVVVTRGEPGAALRGGSLVGDAYALAGAASWVVFSLGPLILAQRAGAPDADTRSHAREWSALRFTALTSIPGTLAIVAIALVASVSGHATLPESSVLAAHGWEVVYLVFVTSVVGVLAWIAGIRRVGPLNATLLANLVPVCVFAVGIARGTRFEPIELGGAALVVGALVANNLYLRRRAPTPAP